MSDNKSSRVRVSTNTLSWVMSIAAFVISYALHKSVLWAILHFILGTFYVLYAIVVYSTQIMPAIYTLFGAGL